ncbi:MAG: hypothetical protein HY047_11225 [Acidobacteria bacterium]|nr:hypothetical protein [Acidobacteriota bacterium]
MTSPSLAAAPRSPGATILYNDRTVSLADIGSDPAHAVGALWIRKADLPRVNEFEVKPQGACRADVCVPIPKTMTRGAYFNLTAFAKKVGQAVVADPGVRLWSFGEIPAVRGTFLESRMAPAGTVPDRTGRPVRLSSFRGKKVLLVTWASW